MSTHITQDELREHIYYNSEFGLFFWRQRAKGRKAWKAAGSNRSDGYLVINIGGRYFYGHRLAWLYTYGEWPDGLVDHIDGSPSNNAISNLRVVTKRGNAENYKGATSASSTGFLGVYRRQDTGKFAAQIKVGGKRVSLGCYQTAPQAYEAYLSAKRRLHPRSLL